MGDDHSSYGVAGNRHGLETRARYAFVQGLTPRLLSVDEMFAHSTLEFLRI